jgi:NAD(P)-dependent dehydrogenase (short-subunit alcohol dehydrogenase family)
MAVLLRDKVCIVTGAASLRGIGYATAELFAEHGAKVVVADLAMNEKVATDIRTSIDRKVSRPADLHGVRCDIGSFDDCKTVFESAVSRFGRVDCLVNCAAVVKSQPFLAISETDYDFVVDVNLKGAFNLGRAAVEHFCCQQGRQHRQRGFGSGPARRGPGGRGSLRCVQGWRHQPDEVDCP